MRITYLVPAGAPIVKEYDLRRESRMTLSIDYEDSRLASTPVSAIVESLDSTIVVERSMWWPGQGTGRRGIWLRRDATSQRWALADGETGGARRRADLRPHRQHVGERRARRQLTILYEQGAPEQQTVAIPPNSRITVP